MKKGDIVRLINVKFTNEHLVRINNSLLKIVHVYSYSDVHVYSYSDVYSYSKHEIVYITPLNPATVQSMRQYFMWEYFEAATNEIEIVKGSD